MKKLNKLLLMGAALSGTLVPKTGAFVDIPLKGGKGSLSDIFLSSETQSVPRKIYIANKEAILQSTYPDLWLNINNTSIVANEEDEAIEVSLLHTLDKLMETPLMKILINKINSLGEKLSIKYDHTTNKTIPTTLGITEYQNSMITIYGQTIKQRSTNGIPVGFPYKPELSSDKYLINEIKKMGNNLENNNLSKIDAILGNTSITLAHELGHIVHVTFARYRNKQLGKNYTRENMDQTDRDTWLGNFYHEYEEEMAPKLKKNEEAWEKLKPTKYSKTSLQDRFAEDFAKAIMKGTDLGETEESKMFESVLDRFIRKDLNVSVVNCLTPPLHK